MHTESLSSLFSSDVSRFSSSDVLSIALLRDVVRISLLEFNSASWEIKINSDILNSHANPNDTKRPGEMIQCPTEGMTHRPEGIIQCPILIVTTNN